MDNSFDNFLKKINRLGICDEYAERVANAGSKKSFVNMALSASALPWVCDIICKGHLTPDLIEEYFAPFNNGQFIRAEDGYTSSLWCNPEDKVTVTTTASLIISHKGEVIVNRPIGELYLVKSNVVIKGDGIAKVHLFNSSVINPDNRVVVESQKDI